METAVVVLRAGAAGGEVCAGDWVRVAEAAGPVFGVPEGVGRRSCVDDCGLAAGWMTFSWFSGSREAEGSVGRLTGISLLYIHVHV
jgi:hypothetical protein